MDPAVEHVVYVLRCAASIHLGDVPFRVVGVAVHRVVGHVACRIVRVAAGRNLVVGRVDRRIEIIACLQGGLRYAIAIAIVTVSVVLHRPAGDGARGQTVEPVPIAVGDLLVEDRVGLVAELRPYPTAGSAVNLRSAAASGVRRAAAHPLSDITAQSVVGPIDI
jgi:hypothetical protein